MAVNTMAVPLYLSRDLQLTAVFYIAYWLNACIALRRWRLLLNRREIERLALVPGAQ